MYGSLMGNLLRAIIAATLTVAALGFSTMAAAVEIGAVMSAAPVAGTAPEQTGWFHETAMSERGEPEPPSKLAIIACRVEAQSRDANLSAPAVTEPDWLLPMECMRVVETVTDAAAMTNLWLRPMQPNLAEHGSCAEVAMNYAPEWEASHRNWLIVKIGCPTAIVDADGRTIGWHMPECQGTLPGTAYPLRCRFDPSEI